MGPFQQYLRQQQAPSTPQPNGPIDSGGPRSIYGQQLPSTIPAFGPGSNQGFDMNGGFGPLDQFHQRVADLRSRTSSADPGSGSDPYAPAYAALQRIDPRLRSAVQGTPAQQPIEALLAMLLQRFAQGGNSLTTKPY